MRQHRALLLFVLILSLGFAGSPVRAYAEELKPEFQRKIIDAITAYHQKDFAKAEKLLDEADAIQPGTIAATNVRGAIQLEQGNIAAARSSFEKALEMDPEFYPAKYNLAEIPYQEKNYPEARKEFQALLKENPKDELAQFKIFLTYLLEQNVKEAFKSMESIPWPGDTPAYYFSHAAWEYAHRNVKDAEGYIASAAHIFSPSQNNIYAETLQELGWLKARPAATAPSP